MDNQKELLAELERGLSELKEKIAVMEKLIAEYNGTETSDSEENGEVAEHIELVHEDFLPEISEAVQEETAPGIIAVEEGPAESVLVESRPEIPAASETAAGTFLLRKRMRLKAYSGNSGENRSLHPPKSLCPGH